MCGPILSVRGAGLLKRFEKGLDAFEHKDHVIVRYHSYRLANKYVPEPFKAALYKKFGGKMVQKR